MVVEVAAHAGFCMGVSRAMEAAERAAEDGIPSCTLGALIHNPAAVKKLAEKGLEVLFDGSYAANGLCEVRPQEIFCTLNRYRK